MMLLETNNPNQKLLVTKSHNQPKHDSTNQQLQLDITVQIPKLHNLDMTPTILTFTNTMLLPLYNLDKTPTIITLMNTVLLLRLPHLMLLRRLHPMNFIPKIQQPLHQIRQG